MSDIILERDSDGFCDTVHAKYTIPTADTSDKVV